MSVISSFAYERDEMDSPVSITREDGSVVYYEYDANGNRGRMHGAWGAVDWTYDHLDRLIKEEGD